MIVSFHLVAFTEVLRKEKLYQPGGVFSKRRKTTYLCISHYSSIVFNALVKKKNKNKTKQFPMRRKPFSFKYKFCGVFDEL